MNHKRVKMRDHKSEVNLFRNRVIVAFAGILIFTLVLIETYTGSKYKTSKVTKLELTATESRYSLSRQRAG